MSLIDREALIAEYDRVHVGAPGGARKLMVDAPEVRPEPRWIPVTKRLPKENGMYLVTMTEKAKAEELGFDLDEIEVSKMRYNSNGWQLPTHIPSWINEVVKDEVIAWKPLPEPWEGES